MGALNWLRAEGADVLLRLHIQPGAKTSGVVGAHGDALKIRLAAPPVDGRANALLLAFLATTLDIPKSRITLLRGASGRAKCLRITAMSSAAVAQRLQPDQASGAE